MILGSANFGNEYRGSNLSKEQCFELLKIFEDNGGKLVDTADDYGDSINIIREYIEKNNSKLKMILKVKTGLSTIKDYDKSITEAVLVRGSGISFYYHIAGQAIYYPHEINPAAKIISIPDSDLFNPYLPVMKLHAKVYARSHFKIENNADPTYIDDYIIGVENAKELLEDMRRFNV